MSTDMFHYLRMVSDRTIEQDITWRAYDMRGALDAREATYVRHALKVLGLSYAGEHALARFAALYGVPSETSRRTLAAWWVWSRLSRGRRVRGVKPRSAAPLAEGGVPPPERQI